MVLRTTQVASLEKAGLSKKMKLLYIHNTPLCSEKANLVQVIQMCHAFADNRVHTTLALPVSPNEGVNEDDFEQVLERGFGIEKNFSIVTYPKYTIFGKLKMIGGYFGVKKLLKNVHPDVCFLRNVSNIGAVLENSLPVVFESHAASPHDNPALNVFWERYLIRKSTHNRFLKLITISEALASYWKGRNISPSKIMICHDGFNHLQFMESGEKSAKRNRVNLPTERKIVLYLGSLYRDRGIEDILELAKIFKDILFVVVGGPHKEKDELESLVRNQHLANVIFTGHVPHNKVPDYLFAADILLMIWTDRVKTINICSPLKMFEYMAAGRTIVGYGFPTIKEVLTDGENALLAPPGDFAQLKEKLRIALQDPSQERLAVQARELAFNKYSWDRRAKFILENLCSSAGNDS